ncbi:hypothetical protein ACFX5U_20770 [Sphingobacterium sp. SG20118]|uniref:hypothetical protein n=1 Tax=Sphingobacterium sp. SG20118 TaxID=3367156 RepID=UPI0037DFBF22
MKFNNLRIGTLGGSLCSIWASISLGDVLQTVLTAIVGTCVSVVVSRVLGRWRRRR